MDSNIIAAFIGGAFAILAVFIAWHLNEKSKRRKPENLADCFFLAIAILGSLLTPAEDLDKSDRDLTLKTTKKTASKLGINISKLYHKMFKIDASLANWLNVLNEVEFDQIRDEVQKKYGFRAVKSFDLGGWFYIVSKAGAIAKSDLRIKKQIDDCARVIGIDITYLNNCIDMAISSRQNRTQLIDVVGNIMEELNSIEMQSKLIKADNKIR